MAPHLDPSLWHDDPDTRELFGKDWTGRYKSLPRAVLFPKSTEEVAQCLAYCHAHEFAVVPAGGRTGLVGGAVPTKNEVVLSLEKMNHIGEVDLRSRTLTAGAGAITAHVNQVAEPHTLVWPIRTSAEGSTQIGGNLATNVGGMHVLRYGMARRWVEAVTVVLMDGTILNLGGLAKDNAGYSLKELFIGSEGTLGVITEATLRLTQTPRRLSLALFAIESIDEGLEILKLGHQTGFLHACEFFSRGCYDIVAKHSQGTPPLPPAKYYVLMEMVTRDFPSERFQPHNGVLAQSNEQRSAFWAIRERITEALAQEGPVHKNDLALPLDKLGMFCSLAEKGTFYKGHPVYLFGHLGDGNVHLNVVGPNTPKRFYEICNDEDPKVFQTVQQMSGSISAEHGIGQLKRASLHYTRSQEEMKLYKQFKKMFDPKGLLNPGKLI